MDIGYMAGACAAESEKVCFVCLNLEDITKMAASMQKCVEHRWICFVLADTFDKQHNL